jgi:hypothetical protein
MDVARKEATLMPTKSVRTGISVLLLGVVFLSASACQTTSTTPNVAIPQTKICLKSVALGLFDGAELAADHPSKVEVAFTLLQVGLEITADCYSVVHDLLGQPSASQASTRYASAPHAAAQQLAPPVVSKQLADTYPTPTAGFSPIAITFDSSAKMVNCTAAPVTGVYAYNIPAEMVVGSDTQQETFVEPIVSIPNQPRVDTLPPTRDTASDPAAVAQHLFDQDNIGQYFNAPGQYSDALQVTIPPQTKTQLHIPLTLHYRYGEAAVGQGDQATGWLWMYTYTFTQDRSTITHTDQLVSSQDCA